MKDISNSVDDKLKIYASSQKVNIPDSYNLMVENCVDRCLKENVPAKYLSLIHISEPTRPY